MKTVSAAKFAAQFNDYLQASQEQPVLVTRNGKPVAVLLAVQNQADAEQLASVRLRPLRSILQFSEDIRCAVSLFC
ncbi:MAG: type II toxin-antitoxin system Phd/YefM family antitoxin [Isosphaeraceae bacterium]